MRSSGWAAFGSLLFVLFLAGDDFTSLKDVGDRAPDFDVSVAGKATRLGALLKDGPVLVRFAATGCEVCTAEFPYVEKMQAAYARKGFRIINVMNDEAGVVARLRQKTPSLLFVADVERAIRKQFGVPRVPTSFLIDRDGEIASLIVQFSSTSLNRMSAQVATLVKQPAAVVAPLTLAPRSG